MDIIKTIRKDNYKKFINDFDVVVITKGYIDIERIELHFFDEPILILSPEELIDNVHELNTHTYLDEYNDRLVDYNATVENWDKEPLNTKIDDLIKIYLDE